VLFYGAALVACPAVADETTILFNVTIAYILYFYVCLMYNKAIIDYCSESAQTAQYCNRSNVRLKLCTAVERLQRALHKAVIFTCLTHRQ